jgi:hypothetical protein
LQQQQLEQQIQLEQQQKQQGIQQEQQQPIQQEQQQEIQLEQQPQQQEQQQEIQLEQLQPPQQEQQQEIQLEQLQPPSQEQQQEIQLEQPDVGQQGLQVPQEPPVQQEQHLIAPVTSESAGGAEGGEYRARAELAEARAKELEEQINAFREAAIGALTPLVPEVNRLMQALSDEVAQIQTLVSQARQHLQASSPPERMMGLSELQKLETTASEMQGRVEAIRSTLTTRLQEVLGEPEDAPAQQG